MCVCGRLNVPWSKHGMNVILASQGILTIGEYNAGVEDSSRNRQLTRVFTTATDLLTPDRIASPTPPGITYNQQIRLTYTTTPDIGNETPEGDHTFEFLSATTPLKFLCFTQEVHRVALRVSLLHKESIYI